MLAQPRAHLGALLLAVCPAFGKRVLGKLGELPGSPPCIAVIGRGPLRPREEERGLRLAPARHVVTGVSIPGSLRER